MIKHFFIHIVFLTLTYSSAQTAESILQEYLNVKRNETSLQVDISYSMYKGKNGKEPTESYKGVQAHLGKTFYQKLGTMEYIQGEDFMVKLNTEEKAMLVGYSSKPILNDLSLLNNEAVLGYFKDMELKDMGNKWLLIAKSNVTSLMPFSKMEFYLSKKDYKLYKQVVYYSSLVDYSDSYKDKTIKPDYDNPRLEVVYTNHSNKISLKKNTFSKERYFTYKNNNIIASNLYKGYSVVLHDNPSMN